ncbi:hypothetical protein ACIQV3_35795 [Streptomyces sp. NPDC099050]|uniref:hypothetical protein n=1 Tax=Streptomyces sp. NPDC099050 TaxID=3366100 RepID=UPI00382ACDE8
MTWKNEISWGDVAAVAAVLLAMWQLVSSSRALIRERRADFYLEQLAQIAVHSLESGGTNASPDLSARIRFLPESEFPMPLLRAWALARFAPDGVEPLWRRYRAAAAPYGTDDSGLTRWLREQGRAEVDAAVAHVLEMRVGRLRRAWRCWRSSSRR